MQYVEVNIQGMLNPGQFWPIGTSDADTTKLIVSTGPTGIQVRPVGAKKWKTTRVLKGAVMKKVNAANGRVAQRPTEGRTVLLHCATRSLACWSMILILGLAGCAPGERAAGTDPVYVLFDSLAVEVAPPLAETPADSDFVLVPVFYGTDRNVRSATARADHYGTRRDSLRVGVVTVSIPKRAHRPGNVERPSKFLWVQRQEDPKKHVLIADLVEVSFSDWTARAHSAVDSSESGELFVYIHGFRNTFDDAARRTGQLAYDLGLEDAVTAMFSWPSRGTISGYPADEAAVESSIPHFRAFLERLIDSTGTRHVSLLSHSMGGRLLTAVVRELRRDRPTLQLAHIVLAAPDIDAQTFRDQVAPAIEGVAGNVTVYTSRGDRALQASKKFHQFERAGEGGSLVLAMALLEKIDAGQVDTDLLGHGYFAENKQVLDDLFMLLRHDIAADSRNLKRIPGLLRAWQLP